MRKRILGSYHPQPREASEQSWLDVERIATVEVTSEDARFPIENVFASNAGPGWRAAVPGEQHIRLLFDSPVSLHRIQLRFDEAEHERTQEFILRWASISHEATTDIVRQQGTFSPAGSTTEIERYVIDLDAVSVLELAIVPDIGGGKAVATVGSWRLA
jgi:hypothetical protein